MLSVEAACPPFQGSLLMARSARWGDITGGRYFPLMYDGKPP